MKVIVILALLSCSFVYNLKLKVKNNDLSELENEYGNSAKFTESIFSEESN
jgi:hypothetical protein